MTKEGEQALPHLDNFMHVHMPTYTWVISYKLQSLGQWTSLFAKPGNETDREQTIYTRKSKNTTIKSQKCILT